MNTDTPQDMLYVYGGPKYYISYISEIDTDT